MKVTNSTVWDLFPVGADVKMGNSRDEVQRQLQKPYLDTGNQNSKEEDNKISKEDVQKKISSINKFMEPSHTSLRFQIHDKLKKFYIEIIDTKTKEVVKEIPAKKFLDMYADILESIGLIIDYRI